MQAHTVNTVSVIYVLLSRLLPELKPQFIAESLFNRFFATQTASFTCKLICLRLRKLALDWTEFCMKSKRFKSESNRYSILIAQPHALYLNSLIFF